MAPKTPPKRRRAKQVPILRLLAGGAGLWEIAGDTIMALTEGNLSSQKLRSAFGKIQKNMTDFDKIKSAVFPIAASQGIAMLAGRSNPGITVGRFRLKAF